MPGSSKWPLSLRFLPKLCMQFSSPLHTCYMPAPLILLDLITWIIFGEEYRSLSSSYSFLYSSVTSSLLGPPILRLPQPTFAPQCEWPCFTPIQNNRTILYILIFIVLDSNLEDKRCCTEWYQALPGFNLLLISSWIEFPFAKVVSKYLKYTTLSGELFSVFIFWLCPAFWSQNMTMYLILSAFTCSPVCLLANTKGSVFFFFMECSLPSIVLASSV